MRTAEWIVAPDNEGRALHDVLPSALAALGVPGWTDTIGIPESRQVVVLLVDGLGWELLSDHAADAPFLATHARDSAPGRAGFPTTTATSITSLGTGMPAGQHGIVGYTFAEPSGGLLHPLSWARHGAGARTSLLAEWPPETAQPRDTVLGRAVAAGVDARLVVPAEFAGTGLTRAGLRGGQFRGVHAMGDVAAEAVAAATSPGPVLCYAYHGQLDHLGHVHGPGSLAWRLQLSQVDRMAELIAERLPSSASLVVVADHGMVEVDPARHLDADAESALLDGVAALGGEVRCRHVYAEPGAVESVRATWSELVGERGVVVSRDEAVAAGWFGPSVAEDVAWRIGDVLAVMREGGIARWRVEPRESALRGQHGSLTAAEQHVPMIVRHGRAGGR